MIKITYKLILLLSLLAMTVTSFAASEAEYGKVSKAWTLHADGSQEYRSSMELTLFTHTAMNSTYGESFIVYNPDFQTLKIHSSYTRQKDGTMTEVPHPAEKGGDYRYFLFGEDFAYAHYLRDDWYYREYYDWTVMSKNRQGVYEDISRQLAGAYKIAHVGRVGDCPGVLSVVVENGEEERRLLFEKREGQYLATTAEVLEIRQNGRKFSRPVCWKPAAKLDVRDEAYVLAEAKRMSGR